MKCPHCNYNDSKVLDSREIDDGIRRRRECLSCGGRFTTYERVQMNTVFIIKKDTRREPFQKDKLLNGIRKACEKRPIAAHVIDKIADDIELELHTQGKAEVPSSVIGDMVMDKLKRLDHIAYIRFASVYRDFADITRLKQEVDSLASTGGTPPSAQLSLLPEVEVSTGRKTGGRHRR